MSVAAVTVLAAEEAAEPAVPPLALGIGTFLVLCLLLLITWQFNRDR